MPDLTYDVAVALKVTGDAMPALGALGGKVSSLSDGFRSLGGKAADAFTGLVESAGAAALSMGKIAVGAGLAGAAYGVLKLNAGLETTQTSIAAVLNAQGEVGNMGTGLDKAGTLVAKMRQDAKELPGEFGDLMGIFQSGMAAAGNAGLDSIKFEKLSANAMAAAKAMSVPMDQAGRELAQLLEGRAGAHNVFGTRLGIHAEGFNKSSDEERVKKITEALTKFEPAIKVFGTTFDAISSTFVDNIKQFGMKATGPLFDRIKMTLGDINSWFDENQGQVAQWANQLGRWLGEAFDSGKAFILEWWPAISQFAENAYNKLTSIWKDIGPAVASIGESIRGFLKDPGSIDKIIHVLELYAAVKVGGAAMDLFSGFGGGKAAGGGGGAASLLGGTIGQVTLVAGAVTLGSQVMQWLAGNSGKEYDVDTGKGELVNSITNLFVRKAQYVTDEENYHARLIQQYGSLGLESSALQAKLASLGNDGDYLSQELLSVAAAANSASGALGSLAGGMGEAQHDEITAAASSYIGMMNASGVASAIAKAAAPKEKDKKGGGGGGAQKVEITINSNQAPGQIARAVVDEIVQRQKHPRSSVHVRNFSAVTRGG